MFGILLVVYLLLGRMIPWSLAICVGLYVGKEKSLLTAVITSVVIGMIEDIQSFRPLGLTSAWLLTVTLAVFFIEGWYRLRWPWWWWIVGILGELGIRWLHGRPVIEVTAFIGLSVTLFIIQSALLKLRRTEGIYVGKS